MRGRSYIIGAGALLILMFSAIAAQPAFAEQQAYECSPSAPTKTFSDAHCLNSGGSSFGHIKIEGTTEVTGTNAKTASGTTAAAVGKLRGTIAGVETEIQCTEESLLGGKLTLGFIHVKYDFKHTKKKCTVTKPAGKGCVVNEATIQSNELSATTLGQAANNVKVTPAEGTTLASVKIESCSISALNNTFSLTGSYIATASGATLSTTHAGVTAQETLFFAGVEAGLEGALTISSAATGNGIALT